MKVISEPRLREYSKLHPLADSGLRRWRELAKAADWKSRQDVKKSWPLIDFVKVASGRTVAVFNIAGNNFRLIAAIHFNTKKVFVLRCSPHHEYPKDYGNRDL